MEGETDVLRDGMDNLNVEADIRQDENLDLKADVNLSLDLSYLSNILLKHTQLQALVEAEFTMLPRPLHFMMTL